MKAKQTLFATVLGTLVAAPVIGHAESQAEWFLRQQQMTDGYTAVGGDPSYPAHLRSNGLPVPGPATPSSATRDAQRDAGDTQISAGGKSEAKKSE
jgi:hypothetical protein